MVGGFDGVVAKLLDGFLATRDVPAGALATAACLANQDAVRVMRCLPTLLLAEDMDEALLAAAQRATRG